MHVSTGPDLEMLEAIAPAARTRGDRLAWCLIGAAGMLAFALAGLRFKDEVVYNGSASMPLGFYLRIDGQIERGSIVTVRASDVAEDYARRRRFTGAHDRFIKHVVGVSGDRVCADAAEVTLNGRVVAHRQTRDSDGRVLPSWSGCETLQDDQIFLLGETETSFDGRYFGPVKRSTIEGVWRPLFGALAHNTSRLCSGAGVQPHG